MPIGIVSDDEFNNELGHVRTPSPNSVIPNKPVVLEGTIEDVPTSPVSIIDQTRRGRKEGDTNIPESLRAIIGEEALLNGRQAAIQLAKDFGISPSSVSAYTNGATSTASYNEPKPGIIDHINKARARATKKAAKTLNAALGSITQEKLDYLDADKLSGVAKDMSVIIKNLEPKSVAPGEGTKQGPQFVIFSPQFRDERSYDVITVSE